MKFPKTNILFISHEASLSGAPLVLLNFVRWLKHNKPSIKCDVLLLKGGDYIEDYRQVFNEVIFIENRNVRGMSTRISDAVTRRLGLQKPEKFLRSIARNNYQLLYCNTVATLNWGLQIKNVAEHVKLILHVHELNAAIRLLVPDFLKKKNEVDLFIGASKAVIANLVTSYNIDPQKIELIYEFIDLSKTTVISSKPLTPKFLVGSSGYVDWRKGYDLFLLLANTFKTKYPDVSIHFQWVGQVPDRKAIIIDEDIRKLGLGETVVFSGQTTTPLKEFEKFDIFMLLSREDPFPLVCLEAGSLGKPIICFEKGGGICELIADGGGMIVPYLNIEEVAKAILVYYKDRKQLSEDGNFIRNKILDYNVEKVAPQLFKVLEAQLNKAMIPSV